MGKKKISEVGEFSIVLQDILLFFLQKTESIEDNISKECSKRKEEDDMNKAELQRSIQEEASRLKQIIKKENEERQRDMKDIEGFVKKENAERKRETQEISDKMGKEEEKRVAEAKALEDKLAK